MVLIHIDLRLTGVEFELWALEEHLLALEESVGYLKAQDRIRTEARLRERGLDGDEAEVQLAFRDHDQRVNHVLPRYLGGSFLIALWAVFEAAVRDIADHLRYQKRQELRLGDIRGDLLERGQKYFKHVLGHELLPDAATADKLQPGSRTPQRVCSRKRTAGCRVRDRPPKDQTRLRQTSVSVRIMVSSS